MGKQKSLKRIAVGAAVAGAAGYLAGIVTAPRSGRDTRKDLKKATSHSMSDIEKQLKEMHTELGSIIDDAQKKGEKLSSKAQKELAGLVGKATTSKEKMREVISAVHEGEASDSDLSKAMTDAKHAIDHIKNYLHKK